MIKSLTESGMDRFYHRLETANHKHIRGMEAKLISINKTCDGVIIGNVHASSAKDLARLIKKLLEGGQG